MFNNKKLCEICLDLSDPTYIDDKFKDPTGLVAGGDRGFIDGESVASPLFAPTAGKFSFDEAFEP